jgi:hypothetical protein
MNKRPMDVPLVFKVLNSFTLHWQKLQKLYLGWICRVKKYLTHKNYGIIYRLKSLHIEIAYEEY